MSDEDPSTPLPVVDRPLQRRVAWGLLAGRSKAEIAVAEGISDNELNAALTGPCMFMLVNIWGVFFKEGDRGDLPLLRRLVGWALDFVIENADRTQGAGIAKAFLIKVSFKLSFNSTLKFLCDHIEGVIGVQDERTPLRGVRGRLVELMSWALEIALMQLFIYQLGEDEIVRRDEHFRANILLQEFDAYSVDVYEVPAEAAPPLAEPVAETPESEPVATMVGRAKPTLVWSRPDDETAASSAARAESDPSLADPPAAIDSTLVLAEGSVTSFDRAAPLALWLVGSSPTMTTNIASRSRPTLSWPASEPANQGCEARIPNTRIGPTWSRLVHIEHDVKPVERPPIVRNLLYESVRHKRRRCSLPPLVRHLPIGRAA